MTEYYFDIETTGLDPAKDKIITIHWQRLNGFTGEPIGELQILKEWESSEKEILEKCLPLIQCERPFDFIFIGKNLLFDFNFLDKRGKAYGFRGFDVGYCHDRVFLDLKHSLVLVNNGKFKDYDKILDLDGALAEINIPKLYYDKKYQDIINYIHKETSVTLKGFQILKREMPALLELFRK